jgi:hypothetical protein
MSWPPNLSAAKHISFRHLTRRASEATYFLDGYFKPAPLPDEVPVRLEFVDVNSDMKKRIMVTDSTGAYKNPWKDLLQTLTGNSKVMVRTTTKDEALVRPLLGTEYFALCGWFLAAFKEGARMPAWELSAGLCGSCFSAYHIGPVLMALVSMVQTSLPLTPSVRARAARRAIVPPALSHSCGTLADDEAFAGTLD